MPDAQAPTHEALRPQPWQFGLQAMLGSLVTVGLLCAYLRHFDQTVVSRCAMTLGAAALLGALAGALARNVGEGMFWAVMGCAWAYLAVVTALVLPEMRLLWPLIGAVAGASTGTAPGRRPLPLLLLGAMTAGTVFLVWAFMLFVFHTAFNLIFDFCCALLAGAGLGAVVYVSRWLEFRVRLPRFVLAALLMAGAIAMSWGTKRFVPGW